MADIKFSEFQKATTSKDSDEIAILQDGVNKMIPSPILESKIINKTVSRVIEQGGASLNVINLKGVVPTYADLALITPTPELNDAYQVVADGLVYVYTDSGFQADGDGIVVQPEPNGVVEEGNTEAVSGGEVFDKVINKSDLNVANFSINEFRLDLITKGNLDSNGNIIDSDGKFIKNQPVNPSTAYRVSGMVANSDKRLVFKDIDKNKVGSVQSLGIMPRTVTTTPDTYYIDYDIMTESESESVYATLQIEQGTTESPYVSPKNYISKIEDLDLTSKALTEGNTVPFAVDINNAVNLGQMYNEYQGKIYTGNLKNDIAFIQHRNLLNDVITDIKVSGAKPNKFYQIRTIAFKDATLKDYTTFNEYSKDINGNLVEEKFYTAIASGVVNTQIPNDLQGKVYSKYELMDGIVIEIWFDFDRKKNWTLTSFPISSEPANVGYGTYINTKKVYSSVNSDYVRRNYQGFILSGTIPNTSNANAINLYNEVIEDIRITGAKDEDVFQIWSICFDHPTLKDYVRFRKGHLESNIPVWDSDQTLYSGQEHPDYPSTLTGKCRAIYNLQNGVKIEIWFDFDKKKFTQGTLIAVSDTISAYGYQSYFSKAKMLPENLNIPQGVYPTFPNAKILTFGDSITATNGGVKVTWVQPAMAMLGNPTYVDYASGGSAFRERGLPGIKDMPTQLDDASVQTNVDAVIIAMGTNEFHSPAPPVGNNTPNVGSFSETMERTIAEVISNVETLGIDATMYDAMRYTFYKIQQTWDCKIYVCLPIQRARWTWDHVETLYKALEEMAISYGAETVDLRRCGIVTDFEVDGNEGRDLSDGLHPKNPEAYGKIAKMVVSAVRNTLVL